MSQEEKANVDWEDLEPPGEGSLLGDYRVELPVFEGPMDLLLHLIKKHEINIFDIPISLVTDKYLAYLEWMRVLNLDIAGEFLVMAATLAFIKSKMLLPAGEGQGDDAEDEEGDPREELVRRLLDYQRYKEAAEAFKDRPVLDRDVFSRGPHAAPLITESGSNPFGEVSVFRLIEAFDRVVRNSSKRVPHEVTVDRISIADRIHELVDLFKERREVTFEELFLDAPTRSLIVATFMALLEMARLRMVRLHQPEESESIYIRYVLESVDLEKTMSYITAED